MIAHSSLSSPDHRRLMVLKNVIEASIVIAGALIHFLFGAGGTLLLILAIGFMLLSLLTDLYLFGSWREAVRLRKSQRHKLWPILVAMGFVILLIPSGDEVFNGARAALGLGIGLMVTALLNLLMQGHADA
jgi:hypothetical protein